MRLTVIINNSETGLTTAIAAALPDLTTELVLKEGLVVVKAEKEVVGLTAISKYVYTINNDWYYLFDSTLTNKDDGKVVFSAGIKLILNTANKIKFAIIKGTDFDNETLSILPSFLLAEKKQKTDADFTQLANALMQDVPIVRTTGDRFYYYNSDDNRWISFSSKYSDATNVLISKSYPQFSKAQKIQVIDSLVPLIYKLPISQQKQDCIVFKNNIVLDTKSMRTYQMSSKLFVLTTINANWYTEEKNIPAPNEFFVSLLNGLSADVDPDITMQNKENLLAYTGYIFSHDRKESNLIILCGGGRNGKSTYAAMLSNILEGNSKRMDVARFLFDSHDSASYADKRLLYFDELHKDQVTELFISKLKELTGASSMSIRQMQTESKDVKSNFVVIITTNTLSDLYLSDLALARRLKIHQAKIPVTASLPGYLDFSTEINRQCNYDWLVNISLRKYLFEYNRDIKQLFYSSMLDAAMQLVTTSRQAFTALDTFVKVTGIVKQPFEMRIKYAIAILLLLTSSVKVSQMLSLPISDDKLNLLIMHIIGIPDILCVNGMLQTNKHPTVPLNAYTLDDDIVTEFAIHKETKAVIIKFISGKVWTSTNQHVCKYVLTEVFGVTEDMYQTKVWFTYLQKNCIGQHVKILYQNGGMCITKAKQPTINELDEPSDAYDNVIAALQKISASDISDKLTILDEYHVYLSESDYMKLKQEIYAEYAAEAETATAEEMGEALDD